MKTCRNGVPEIIAAEDDKDEAEIAVIKARMQARLPEQRIVTQAADFEDRVREANVQYGRHEAILRDYIKVDPSNFAQTLLAAGVEVLPSLCADLAATRALREVLPDVLRELHKLTVGVAVKSRDDYQRENRAVLAKYPAPKPVEPARLEFPEPGIITNSEFPTGTTNGVRVATGIFD